MEIQSVREKHHPATAVMLNYLNNKVGMKKIDEWCRFFKKYNEKNSLANEMLITGEKIIRGEKVDELDFVCFVWMLLRFDKDDEIQKEKKWIEKEKRKLAKNSG